MRWVWEKPFKPLPCLLTWLRSRNSMDLSWSSCLSRKSAVNPPWLIASTHAHSPFSCMMTSQINWPNFRILSTPFPGEGCGLLTLSVLISKQSLRQWLFAWSFVFLLSHPSLRLFVCHLLHSVNFSRRSRFLLSPALSNEEERALGTRFCWNTFYLWERFVCLMVIILSIFSKLY